MECLDNLIGASKLVGSTSTSGLFLSDIDITLQQANNLQTPNHTSGVDFLNQKIAFAQKEIVQDIITRLRASQSNYKAFSLNTILEQGTVGRYRDNKPTLIANAAVLRGLLLDMCNTLFLSVNVNSVSIMAQTSGDINVEVWDLVQSKLLDTYVIGAVAGEISTTIVNKTYKSNQNIQLAFLYDGAEAAYINDYNKANSCLSCHPTYNTGNCKWTGATITKTSTKILRNISKGGQNGANGLSIDYSVDCDASGIVCQMAKSLAFPLLYKTASLIADSYMLTQRINSTVKIPATDPKDWKVWADGKYNETLDNIIQGIKLPNTPCFKCLPKVSQRTVLP